MLRELTRRGYETVPESVRRIVIEESCGYGAALPWVSLKALEHQAIDLAR
ncbi:hypothetical protein [Phaeobacter sp. C3_T13_0]